MFSRKRYIVITENYIAGGADKFLVSLLRNLDADVIDLYVNEQHDLSIIREATQESAVNLKSYKIPTTANLMRWVNQKTHYRHFFVFLTALLKYPLFVFTVGYFMLKLKNAHADVFIINNGGYPAGDCCRCAAIAIFILTRKRVFHIVHSTAVEPRKAVQPIEWAIDKIQAKVCYFVAVCGAISESLRFKRWTGSAHRIIYNGIAPYSPIKPKCISGVFNILHVGYFDQNKNQSMLVRAVEIIAKECSIPFHVTFVGKDSGTLESVKSLAQDLNVLSYISFVDFQNDLDYYYQTANLLVLCSNQEGFPLVVLEAMRSCLPVVATQVGGTEEQVTDRKTGFLVPKGSHNILADRIRSLIESPSLARQFGLSGYNQFSQKFTLDKMISNYESLFESTT